MVSGEKKYWSKTYPLVLSIPPNSSIAALNPYSDELNLQTTRENKGLLGKLQTHSRL
jgi:hypothetical protein